MNLRGSCIPRIPFTSASASLSLPLPRCISPLSPRWCSPRQHANLLTRPLNLSPCHLAPSMVFPMSPREFHSRPLPPQLEVANCDFKFSTHPPPRVHRTRPPTPKGVRLRQRGLTPFLCEGVALGVRKG